MARINKETANYLRERGVLEDVAAALELKENALASVWDQATEFSVPLEKRSRGRSCTPRRKAHEPVAHAG